MKKLVTPYFIILLFFYFVGVFKAQAQVKYEDPIIERLITTYQFQKLLQVARYNFVKANSYKKKLFYNNCIIRAYSNMGNNDSTMIFAKHSEDLLFFVQDSDLICYTYLILGLVYHKNLDINNSTNYLLKAVNLAKKLNSSFILVRAYNILGNMIENENGNLNLALYYLNLAIKYANDKNFEIKNPDYLKHKISALIDRSMIYVRLGKNNESLNDLFLAKLLSNSLPPNNEKSLILLNMRFSLIYSMINDKKNSDLCINEALKISLTTNDKVNIKESYRILANNCFLFKDYYKAIFYGLKAENYNKNNTENLAGKMYIDSLLYLSYEYIGDNENALKYYKNFVGLKNKYYENGKVNELNKLDIMFKVEENKKKLALNELEQTKDKATIQFLFWIIFVTLLLILMALGYNYLERKRIKLIYSNLENSDKEIKSVKGWLEWRNQNVTNPTSNLDEKETVIENDFNSPAFEIDEKTSLNFEINNVNSKILYYELRELLDTKKLYLNPELTLDDLIKLLGTNKKYLYYAIKLNYEDNFRSLLNEYRINHVKLMMVELVKNNKKIRIEDIQESSGFQSTASFFRVFKSKTGLTPLEYYEQVKQTNFEDEIIKVAV